MIKTDEELLICDFAETYQIYDYRKLPLRTAAILANGLNPNSRIKRKLAGLDQSIDTLLLACIVDRLSLLLWRDTKDASKGKNKPESMYELLTSSNKDVSESHNSFTSGKEFEKERQRILNKIKKGA